MSIESIRHKGLRELYETGETKVIGSSYRQRLIELLDILEGATSIRDLRGVAGFHPLKGKRKGEYSMHVNGPKVLTFKFEDGEARDVSFEDYH